MITYDQVEKIRQRFYTVFPNPEVLSGETATAIRDLLDYITQVRAVLNTAEESFRWINRHSHGEVAGEAMNALEKMRAALEGRR